MMRGCTSSSSFLFSPIFSLPFFLLMPSPSPLSLNEALNETQLEAVTYCDGPALVIAGAGSGKTRVLTFKIAYLLQMGYQPWNILSLTFTNKAAKEMNERITQIVGEGFTQKIWSGTFHSIFSRILRIEAQHIGFTPQFTIYDTTDSRSLLKTIVKDMGLNEKTYKPNHLHHIISHAKNRLVLPAAYKADTEAQKLNNINGIRRAADVYEEYFARCKRSNAMDFDDLLLYTFLLFRDHPEVLARYKERFQYILVDEYQDTNYAQHKIITQLAPPTARIFVVGDDAQSIYSFRGANLDNILRFNEQYPNAHLIKLERNYRSTQTIVEAANSVIRYNTQQIPKSVYSQNEKGELIHVLSTLSDREESLKVVGEINHLVHQHDLSYNDIAILYRTNSQSRSFEETFLSNNIPYRIHGGVSFYQRKEVKDVIAYLRLLINPYDDEALRRIINYPARGIGDTTLKKIVLAAHTHAQPLWEVVSQPTDYALSVNKGTLTKLSHFTAQIRHFIEQSKMLSAYHTALLVVTETKMMAEFTNDLSPENLSKKQNIEELLNGIKSYQDDLAEEGGEQLFSLSDYLSQVSLLTDADTKEKNPNAVTLMTVHAAKGLEYAAVFVTGMEDELFPSSSAKLSRQEMEEERRLFYVALTRAKQFCYLTYATSRYKFGKVEYATPSPFLQEIDEQYLSHDRKATFTAKPLNPLPSLRSFFKDFPASSLASSPKSNTPPPAKLQRLSPTSPEKKTTVTTITTPQGKISCGTRIRHDRFGEGVVSHIEAAGDSSKISVTFTNGDTKNLLLKFAKFTLLT